MRTVSALDVRKKFGALLDEAAAGERLIIERAGQPVAALVPLTDLPELNREERIRRRLEAIDDIARFARQRPVKPRKTSAAEVIRRQRDERADHIWRAIESSRLKDR
jgi:prevent-host-death family protein